MRTRENRLQFIAVFFDLVLLNLAFILIGFVYPGQLFFQKVDFYSCLIISNLAWILAYIIIPKFVLYANIGFTDRLYRMLKRAVVFTLVSYALYFPFDVNLAYLETYVILASSFFLFTIFAVSFIYYKTVKYYHLRHRRLRRTLLIGNNAPLQEIEKIIKANPILDYMYIDNLPQEENKLFGDMNKLEKIIKQKNIHVLFVAIMDLRHITPCNIEANQLLEFCNKIGIRLFYVPANQDIPKRKYNTYKLARINVFNPQQIPLDTIENQVIKRLFDMVFSSVMILLVLSWLYPILAIFIKLSSKGPVLFTQARTGINQITFNCYKFRSMRMNVEADSKQATEDDPRITKIGKFIRKTNLDELPQFFNVFKGDMSVVGPRPHMLAHTTQYAPMVDNYLVRHYVKPGVTGWAQINGLRGETDELWKMEKRVEYDMDYINNWSLDWDFVIVWKTIFALKAFLNAR